MTASTMKHTITSEGWTQIANGESTVAIQIINIALISVYIGDIAPTPESAGITVGRKTSQTPSEFSASGLPETSGVYVRGIEDQSVDLVVMKY